MAKKDDLGVTDPGTPDTPAQSAPAKDDLKMSPDEFAELRAEANRIQAQDYHLGRFLQVLVSHIGHAHGLDASAEDARLAKEARVAARKEEDDRLKAEAEDRVKQRHAQDAIERTPEQKATLQASRDEEDKQLKLDATEREKKRAEEDKAAEDAEANK